MSKHTPGPWEADGKAVYAMNSQGDKMKCVAQCRSKYHPPEIDIANARLIAAAPDLLAALKAMVDRWEPDADGYQDRLMWENARAAIAKAIGAAP